MSKKVLITSRSFGKISNEPLDILTGAGFEVTMKGKDFDQAEFEAMIPDYDALIIGAHEFPEAVMERCPKLKIICKHGAGLDNIHLEKAKELGIAVCNVPGTNSNAVADLTFGLMHTAEKSAEILVKTLSMQPTKRQTITPDEFRHLAKDFGVTLPEEFLYEK